MRCFHAQVGNRCNCDYQYFTTTSLSAFVPTELYWWEGSYFGRLFDSELKQIQYKSLKGRKRKLNLMLYYVNALNFKT